MQPVRSNEHESVSGLSIGRKERLKRAKGLSLPAHIEKNPDPVMLRNESEPRIKTGVNQVVSTGYQVQRGDKSPGVVLDLTCLAKGRSQPVWQVFRPETQGMAYAFACLGEASLSKAKCREILG